MFAAIAFPIIFSSLIKVCQLGLSKLSTAGSFIRPNRAFDTPIGFVEALRQKYASDVFDDGRPFKDDHAREIEVIRIGGKDVQEVGFDRIRHELADLQALRVVILDKTCMSRPGVRAPSSVGCSRPIPSVHGSDVEETSPSIVELDLSRNLFEEWEEVIDICKQLRSLRSLRVDGNRFQRIDSPTSLGVMPSTTLTSLSLDNTLLPWDKVYATLIIFHEPHTDFVDQVMAIASTFPALTALSAAGNEYTCLPPCPALPKLTALNLENNELSSVDDFEVLGRLPSLQTLNLKSNSIAIINSKATFTSLRSVDLAFNAIATWTSVDALHGAFPALDSLRLSHNPLYDALKTPSGKQLSLEDGYMLTVARVGTLVRLNYSEVLVITNSFPHTSVDTF